MDTKGSISPSSNENSYVYVTVEAFTHYIVFHPSPKNDAANALTVLFDHWIVKFGIPIFWNKIAFVTKSHLNEASGLITIIGMLTI